MFVGFYHMREQPFGVTPDSRFLYLSPTHRVGLPSLYYGVEAGRGFMALIAQPGKGRITGLFQLLEQVRKSACVAFLFQTQCNSGEVALSVKSRAQRFVIRMPLCYRLDGVSDLSYCGSSGCKCPTGNIGRSGVLFWGEEFAEPNTPLKMNLVLPDEVFGEHAAELVCRGTVVRSERLRGAGPSRLSRVRLRVTGFFDPKTLGRCLVRQARGRGTRGRRCPLYEQRYGGDQEKS